MPYVSPIVGYFGRLTTSGNLRAYGVCCATPDDYRPDENFTILYADNFRDSGGDGRCESCGKPMTDNPKQVVHVDWGTPPDRYPHVRRTLTIRRAA